ncbi:hypothetical protein BO94DRAFT_583881 [Aspergillus sclerotioniger CBS 115572]|uniref:Uncharacterized protein n=1 Tax=Aspergillus sclerotioniger CBS 115572 TaxID=1450535 RepID=A0A317X2W8_9EURO|nr:hypothetical protein BO94DRAFT_583881 [Aspergillus sclerotioniger CBS 115572]PWY91972.1 hypothetical protein BO94DRAFT_583881 [Aspergillus sclerotioniger CBS 115572]
MRVFSSKQLSPAGASFSEYRDSINIPVGANGSIALDITHPTYAPIRARDNVIIRLPPGPIFSFSPEGLPTYSPPRHRGPPSKEYVPRSLATITSSTIVTINYRLGNLPTNSDNPTDLAFHDYKYPTPVHDTLAGLDWILETLQPSRLSVIGTHIGGSLALMLSLTEAKSIHAVAALEPICDWTSLDEHCIQSPPTDEKAALTSWRNKKHPRGRVAPWDLPPLLAARKAYFSTPERYFDAFASPILFLRSAGKDTPRSFPEYYTGPEYPVPVLKAGNASEGEDLLDSLDVYRHEEQESTHDSYSKDSETKREPPRRRKAISRWPPFGLDYGTSGPTWHHPGQGIKRLEMELPWVRISTRVDDSLSKSGLLMAAPGARKWKRVHTDSVLYQQAHEMVDVMQRACFWGREKGYGQKRVTLTQFLEHDWTLSHHRAADWLREVMMN